jgi:purine-binding chemotaxis protein CheW
MNSTKNNAAGYAPSANQFLTFMLNAEEYGIEILRVQEIKGFSRITPIPNTPRFVKGVINLRGTVVPVVDLRVRFGMDEAEYTRFTVIIVVNVGRRVMGLVVDAVSDVLNIVGDEVQPPPELGSSADTSFMTGMVRTGDRLISLLNLDNLLGGNESTLPAQAN